MSLPVGFNAGGLLALSTLVAVTMASGCATPFAKDLADAHATLAEGNIASATSVLERVQKESSPESESAALASVLLAEAKLQQGDLDGARSLATELLHKDATNPRALEVLGKVALREGQFTQAEEQLSAAAKAYDEDADRQRTADLLELTRGLLAYSEGDLKGAESHWNSIQDSTLAASLDSAVKSTTNLE